MSFRFLTLSSTMRISSLATTHRQRVRKCRARPDLAHYPAATAVEIDELSREFQPESGALHLFVCRPHLTELLEHRLRSSGAMPTPVSATDTSTSPSLTAARSILPPSGVNLMARI